MKGKRKAGERSVVLFDATDLLILKALITGGPTPIMELRKKIGNMKHANLKKHLDALETQRELIKKTSVPKSRKILISLNEEKFTKEKIKLILKIFGEEKKYSIK